MVTKAGMGMVAGDVDSYEAGERAARSAIRNLRRKPDFLILFTTEGYDQRDVVEGVNSVSSETEMIGCCTGGIVFDTRVVKKGVSVLALGSSEMRFKGILVKGLRKDSEEIGRELGERIAGMVEREGSGWPHKTVILLPDGFTLNISRLVESLYRMLGVDYHLVGGGSGDNLRFIRTYQFADDEVSRNSVAAGVILSKKPIGISLRHGWKPMGTPMIVTKSRGKLVEELDGLPAIEPYAEQLGMDKKSLMSGEFAKVGMVHPLGMAERKGDFIIRDPLSVEEEGLRCVSEVPLHSIVRVMESDEKSILKASEKAAEESSAEIGGRVEVAVIFQCISRALLLGRKTKKELMGMKRRVKAPLFGFLTFGEIGFSPSLRIPAFHNKSVAVMSIPK